MIWIDELILGSKAKKGTARYRAGILAKCENSKAWGKWPTLKVDNGN